MSVPVPAHLGPLHPAEQLLVLLLAFGPLALLVVTVWISRRRHPEEGRYPDEGNPRLV